MLGLSWGREGKKKRSLKVDCCQTLSVLEHYIYWSCEMEWVCVFCQVSFGKKILVNTIILHWPLNIKSFLVSRVKKGFAKLNVNVLSSL